MVAMEGVCCWGMVEMVWYREEAGRLAIHGTGVGRWGDGGVNCTGTVLAKIRHLWGISRVCLRCRVRLGLADELVLWGFIYIIARVAEEVVLEWEGITVSYIILVFGFNAVGCFTGLWYMDYGCGACEFGVRWW